MSDDAQAARRGNHPYRWAILFGVWLIYAGFGVTISGIAPLVGPITNDLAISHGAMGLTMGAWPFVYIFSAMPCGVAIDRAGPRLGLMVAAVIMAVSGLARAMADDQTALFLAVAVFGLGGPLVSIGGPKLIALWFNERQRGMAMGVYITGPALGGIAALSLTNAVVMPWLDQDWRAVLTAYAAVTLATGVVWAAINLHPMARRVERDIAAAPRVSQLALFRELVGLRSVQIVLLMSVGIFFFNHGLNNWLPEILRARGMSAAEAGFWASVPPLIGVIASLTIPRFATAERRMAVMAALFAAATGSMTALLVTDGHGAIAGLVLQGFCRGTMMTVALLTLVDIPAIGPARAGAAGGIFFSAAEVGGVSGPLSMGLLFDATGGFTAGLMAMVGVSALLLVLVLPLRASLAASSLSTTGR